MGCLQSSQSSETKSEQEIENIETKPKVYSWDKRADVDPKDYTITNLLGQVVGRTPGEVNGQQIIIKNCENSRIYIFDHTTSVIIENCSQCQIFIGPCNGSIYMRTCRECRLVGACQQFRTRNCTKADVFLCCNTQPIIESSTGMKFACFQYNYAELEGQFDSAGVSIYNNNWSNIHDFTPAGDIQTWSLLPEDAKALDYVLLPPVDQFPDIEVSADAESSVVPRTYGNLPKYSSESCLVVFYPGPSIRSNVQTYIREVSLKTSLRLVQTKEVKMTIEDAKRVFGTEHNVATIQQGAVIGLEVSGDESVSTCAQLLDVVFGNKDKSQFVFISPSKEAAAKNIDDFYNYFDMTMS